MSVHTDVLWNQLTVEEIQLLTNGCGSLERGFPTPDFGFTDPCRRHDFDYFIGGSEIDRRTSNLLMLYGMLLIIDKKKWWVTRFCMEVVAYLYFHITEELGDNFYYYTDTPRGWPEIEEGIRRVRMGLSRDP